MRRIVVLRPEPGASETLARARGLGFDAIAIPLFDVEPVEWTPPHPDGFDGLLLTSANALRQAGDPLRALRGLPVYAVGEATAAAARSAGFDVAAKGEAGVDRLLGSIDPHLRLLHLCGADRKAPAAGGPELIAVPVYRAAPRPAVDLTGAKGSVVLVHSPRAGQRLAQLIGQRSSIALVAISEAAAVAAGAGWDQVVAAAEPTDEAMLALAARLCNKTAA